VTAYSVVGLGKLGASMAAAIAARGFPVVGVDVNELAVAAVNAGEAPVYEKNLAETIAANRERLRATTSVLDAVGDSDVTFVVVQTPSDEAGAFSLQYASAAFREIGHALAVKEDYHLVVLTSTVLPGATRYGLLPFLEAESGKTCGEDFGLCYSPEFIALGSVISDFLNPDFLLVGESDERAGALLEACYADVIENGAPVSRMSIENAELAKIAVNAYVTTKITFANMLADLCERIPGGDVDVVSDAIGQDRRIGRAYLTGGLGFGGPCFPRDNVALSFFAQAMGTRAELCETTHRINEGIAANVVERLGSIVQPGTTVAVLGLAYKPLTSVVEESQGLAIARALAARGAHVVGYDPLANGPAHAQLNGQIQFAEDLWEALRAEVVVIATPDPEFQGLSAADFERAGTKVVVDCWRILGNKLAGRDSPQSFALGRNAARESDSSPLSPISRSVAASGTYALARTGAGS
jgi:UDPglucose 6-dehydrogenase